MREQLRRQIGIRPPPHLINAVGFTLAEVTCRLLRNLSVSIWLSKISAALQPSSILRDMFHPEGIPLGSLSQLSFTLLLTFYLSSLAFPFLFPDFFPLTIPLRSRERMQRTGIFGDDSGNIWIFCCILFFFSMGKHFTDYMRAWF
jgi:hypothetical protein